MPETFKDRLEMDWGIVKLSIKPRKKGTLIYLQERVNYSQGFGHSNEDDDLDRKTCIIIDIPTELDESYFEHVYEQEWAGLQIRYFAGWTEVSCIYPQGLDSGILQVLEKRKIIRVRHKEYSYEKGKHSLNEKINRIRNSFFVLRELFLSGGLVAEKIDKLKEEEEKERIAMDINNNKEKKKFVGIIEEQKH
ncbi:hypothetical protein NDS46_31425 (plasmid) [Paenibacillus thiaminolyticus]|uniref:hypothetical protein n=1 Tax=Paenibacillus thiaminolyticus TaxID=49283 RepID=UPI00232F87E9|nr:hypothetical protein [Paenibacillus thiaminolyticus]WCF11470.1 hypothetical protein NDS46_31425 [Paenibacillus thiaminolyticus]